MNVEQKVHPVTLISTVIGQLAAVDDIKSNKCIENTIIQEFCTSLSPTLEN